LASAFQVLRRHGLARQFPLLIGILVAGVLDGISIAALFPLLTIVMESESAPTKLGAAVGDVLGFLGLSLNLEFLSGLIVASLVVKAVLQLFVTRRVGRMSAIIAEELRRDLLSALIDAQWSHFTVNPVGRFVTAITTEANAASQTYRVALQVTAQAIRTLIVAALALLLGWQLGALAVGLGVVMGLSMSALTRFARKAGEQRQKAMRGLVEELNDALAGFKPLKAMNRQQSLIRELVDETKQLRRAIASLVANEQLSLGLPDLVTAYLLAIGAYFAATVLGTPVDALVIGGVMTFVLMGNVGKLQKVMNQIAQSEIMYWALGQLIADAKAASERTTGRARPTLSRLIRFSKVGFSYGRGALLRNVDLEIPAGRLTALVGTSGVGKSTIADLLLGLHHPVSGRITVDGIDLRDIDLAHWRSNIGFVPQEVILFNDTIRANVALGEPGIDDARVWEALETSGAAGFVRASDQGLDAIVGERGQALSGGQRQRIALARALAARPRLLILDEATSALDPATEAEICRAVRALPQMTVLAITHQPAWVDAAERVYRIERGECRLENSAEQG
jgi:ATP-binding cassette subfamily C protein